jgi:SAM-dependent methyltransferase
MKHSTQDDHYLRKEGDSFFNRNFKDKSLPELRNNKKALLERIQKAKIEFSTVLEYGCCYADLLALLQAKHGKKVVGVEASRKAVAFCRSRYGKAFPIFHGTIADNGVNRSAKYNGYFDLVIVDDVFGWVSRETLLQSAANIDAAIKENGHLLIRDFYPDRRIKNRNHHVKGAEVFNFKVPGSHASLFLATGMYETVFQQTYYDDIGMSTGYQCDNAFNYRWTDVILRKSAAGYFIESKKI